MSKSKLALGTAGIYTAYLSISVLNQRLFTHSYPSLTGTPARFQYADLTVLISALFCSIYAQISIRVKREPSNPVPLNEQVYLGVLYAVNIITINNALHYISYPVRVVADKCGYLTAVLVAVMFSRNKRKPLAPKKFKIALLITAGTLIFALLRKPSQKSLQLYDLDQEWKGYALLLVSITCEALFSDSQAYLKSTYSPTANHLMGSVNILTFLIALGRLLWTNSLPSAIDFCLDHPSVMRDILSSSLLQILGQLSIYFVIINFSQHIFPLIATTRKVFTVLLSIHIYQHRVNGYQWTALVMVFGGMLYELVDELYIQKFLPRFKMRKAQSCPVLK